MRLRWQLPLWLSQRFLARKPLLPKSPKRAFYVASSPDAQPYVNPGDAVHAGDTVCMLEAMKMMSEVSAPCDCIIEELLVADGELVSFDQPLIRYRES